jgi:MarR family transcriptional regulator, organic hydroperoxide resistance regulator
VTDSAKPTVPWDVPRYRNWIAVAKVHQLVERALSAGLAPLDLKLPHYEVMANIYRYHDLTQQELADRLLVGRSNLSMLLPELEKRGLVIRLPDESDRRVRRLRLTDTGKDLIVQAFEVQVRLIEDMMTVLTAEECDVMGDYMRRVGARLAATVRR